MTESELNNQLIDAVSRKDLAGIAQSLKAGANPNWLDPRNERHTAIQEAVAMEFVSGLEKLVEAGGNVNASGLKAMTPLMVAAIWGQIETGRWLLRHGADPLMKNDSYGTALTAALSKQQLDFARMMLAECPSLRESDLLPAAQVAITKNHLETAQWLLAEGISPNIESYTGSTWLGVAQGRNYPDALAISDLLLAAGADINGRGRSGDTPLFQAVISGVDSLVIKLLQADANPDIPDKYGVGVRDLLAMAEYEDMRKLFENWEASRRALQVIEGSANSMGVRPL